MSTELNSVFRGGVGTCLSRKGCYQSVGIPVPPRQY